MRWLLLGFAVALAILAVVGCGAAAPPTPSTAPAAAVATSPSSPAATPSAVPTVATSPTSLPPTPTDVASTATPAPTESPLPAATLAPATATVAPATATPARPSPTRAPATPTPVPSTHLTADQIAATAVAESVGEQCVAAPPKPAKGYVGDAARGKVLFVERGCSACHGAQAQGDVGPKLAGTTLPFDAVLHQLREPRGVMQRYLPADQSDADECDVYIYVKGLK